MQRQEDEHRGNDLIDDRRGCRERMPEIGEDQRGCRRLERIASEERGRQRGEKERDELALNLWEPVHNANRLKLEVNSVCGNRSIISSYIDVSLS